MRDKFIAGIDVGINISTICVMRDYSVISLLQAKSFEDIPVVEFAGIDAPLSYPHSGNFRECEKKLQKMGIPLFPSASRIMKAVTEKGIEIKKDLEKKGVVVYEVYPYATRVILKLAPSARKTSKTGRRMIQDLLGEFVRDLPERLLSHDELDAIISALTVQLFVEGKGQEIEGKDGKIIVPRM